MAADQTEPSGADPGPVTLLLQQAADGSAEAWDRVLDLVYGELRSLAQAHLRDERTGHTLQPTALVHEAYLRLSNGAQVAWQDHAHFLRAAALSMRRILIDHARARLTRKRGGGREALELASVTEALEQEDGTGLLALDEAMEHLAGIHPEAARVVQLRFYADLDSATTARVLGISERTARREWAFARGWLRERLERADRGGAC